MGARLFADRIPTPRLADSHDALELALHGGEDYQLLFTVPAARAAKVPPSFHRVPLHRIGEIRSTRGVEIVMPDGAAVPLDSRGWDHFARGKNR